MRDYLPIVLLCGVVIFQIITSNTLFPPSVATTPPPTSGQWQEDREVTFVGKNARRAADMFNETVKDFKWSKLTSEDPSSANPFTNAYVVIRNVVYVLLGLSFLITAFLIIISRGENITVMKFLPRFVLVFILITLSFSLVHFVYQITDIIQGFFLKIRPLDAANQYISSADLLNVNFDHDFKGYRKYGLEFDEAAITTLLLTKLTAITYYALASVLLFRKILLWLFIILSPVFPLLLLYTPIRNTAKIWLGEFLRWLLYGPLFAILLFGLVTIWQNGIPMKTFEPTADGFNCGADRKEAPCRIYPTAINILLAGPRGAISDINEYSLNTKENFMQYWVALLMLWAVIILPFVLLKIFLDYVGNLSFDSNNALVGYISSHSGGLMGRYGLIPPPKTPPPSSIKPAGSALALPLMDEKGQAKALDDYERSSIVASIERTAAQNNIQSISSSNIRSVNQPVFSSSSVSSAASSNVSNLSNISQSVSTSSTDQILQLTNLSIPTITDIVRYETQMMSNTAVTNQQFNQINESLNRISNTSPIVTPQERERYTKVKEVLVKSAQTGNPVASTILTAAKATPATPLPKVNNVQQVNLEEYELVKKMWKENFTKLSPPMDANGKPINREEWIRKERSKIEEAINMLNSQDIEQQKRGKELVGKLLPFLLLGGFSQAEIVAYLKAKKAAADSVEEELKKKNEEEDTLLERGVKKEEAAKHMTATASIDQPSKPTLNQEQGKEDGSSKS